MQTPGVSRPPILLTAGLALWASAVIAASSFGWLSSLSPLAPPRIALATILLAIFLSFSVRSIRLYLERVGLRRLAAIHILRIVAVPFFFWYGREGLLPMPFVRAAGWGDLASGLLALAAVTLWQTRSAYWTMHLFGMLDFVTAFGTAIRLTGRNPGAMHAITGLPMALIPFFGVGVLATTHVVAYRMLLRSRRTPAASRLPLRGVEAS